MTMRPEATNQTAPPAFGWHRRCASPTASITLLVLLTTYLQPALAWAAEPAPRSAPELQAAAADVSTRGSELVRSAAEPTETRRATPQDVAGANVDTILKGAPAALPSPEPAQLASLPVANNAVSAQSLSMPSGAATAGGMGESFSAQLTTGIVTFKIPLSTPAGRGSARPELNLVYGSSGGWGLAGTGWSLSGGMSISRQTYRGTPRYDDRSDWHPEQDRFVFGSDELVPICKVDGVACAGALADEVMPAWANGWQYFRARIEGSFLRFFWSPDHLTWRVQSKAGMHFELGQPLDGTGYALALERNPQKPAEVFRWHVVRQYDSHGEPDATPLPKPANLALFRYVQDGNVAYLSDVYYTPPAALPLDVSLDKFAHHVRLKYEARNDPSVTFTPGWSMQQRLRLSGVDVASKPFVGGVAVPRELLRRYHLRYDHRSHNSLLSAVELEGRCNTTVLEDAAGALPHTACPRLPASTFEYQRVDPARSGLADANGFEFEPLNEAVRKIADSPRHSLHEAETSLFDINADSLPDVLVTAPAVYGGQHGIYLSRGVAAGSLGFAAAGRMAVLGGAGVDAGVLKLGNPNVAALDLDGNGNADLLHMPRAQRYQVFSVQRNGSSFAWNGRTVVTKSGQDVKIDFTRSARRTSVMDVNGDGLVDVVVAGATDYQTFFSLGRYPGGDGQFGQARMLSATTAEISNTPALSCLPWSSAPVRLGDPDVRVADMNGDGLPDLVRLRAGQILYWPGRGNGFWGTGDRYDCKSGAFGTERHISMLNAPPYGATEPGKLQLADVNGDGLTDLVELRSQAVDLYLNDSGHGWTTRHTLANVPFVSAGTNPVQVTDINASGSTDLLWGRAGDYQYVDLTGGKKQHLLTRLHNGLGKTIELEYRASSELMVEAANSGRPWSSVMPMSTPVVVRVTTRDNLERIGRPAGRYVLEYSYRDPVYDGRQREFRGFRTSEVRTVGDVHQPTMISRSTHLLAECVPDALDSCEVRDRWKDAWREPLKGRPILSETFDEQGVYLNTSQASFEVRQLYTGRDGRRVSVAYATGSNVHKYDTAQFVGSSSSVELPAINVNLQGLQKSEAVLVPRRAASGFVRVRTSQTFDNYGHALATSSYGCIEGCAAVDDAITKHVEMARPPGDTSGWLFRNVRSYVTSAAQPARRHETSQTHNAFGDAVQAGAVLSGTLPLVRVHAGGGAVAPPPANASAGISAPVALTLSTTSYDAFGSPTGTRTPLGRCRTVTYDPEYAELVVAEKTFGGSVSNTGCGDREFATLAEYDRGFGVIVRGRSIDGQPSRYELDGFGRLVAEYHVDPERPGVLATRPMTAYEYHLPSDPSATPFSIVVVRSQDGSSVNDDEYHERVSYLDGLSRTIFALSEADPSAGDAGQYIVQGAVTYDARGSVVRDYLNEFWNGNPLQFPLHRVPATAFTTTQLDAFGRPVASFGLDGEWKAHTEYHALSSDLWDAEDLNPGPHYGTFATSRSDGHGRSVEAIERIRVAGVLELRSTLHDFLPTGEVARMISRRSGSPDVIRWLRYDSLGRMVMNVEPNTSPNFTANTGADPNTIKAWRYAYDVHGDLVGVSDSRGCGVNNFYDAAGRTLGIDYSPCASHQAPYTPPDLVTGNGLESFTRYDTLDPDTAGIVDENGAPFQVNSALLWGRVASTADRASKGLVRYDTRGQITGRAVRVTKPHGQAATPAAISERFAPRWYTKSTSFDAAGRAVTSSTGARSPELMGAAGKSTITQLFSRRGHTKLVTSSYGVLLQGQTVDANGLLQGFTLGDAAQTQRTYTYDSKQRVQSVQTFRAVPELWQSPGYSVPPATQPTQQLLLEDLDFAYDAVRNITQITDWRTGSDWPASAKPVTRRFEYDDAYRLTRVVHEYASGATWQSPFDAENTGQADPAGTKPSPHVAYDQRVVEQRFEYDHLGNTSRTTDDANGFYDRSLGTTTQGTATAGPHQLRAASNRALAPTSTRKGDLSAGYDDGGNLTDLIVRRDGPCLPSGSSCWQRFRYEWDEVGQLSRAVRYDLAVGAERTAHAALGSALPARSPNVELRYTYDSGGARVLKTASDAAGQQAHTVNVFSGLELRQTGWSAVGTNPPDYGVTARTENVLLYAGAATARVVFARRDLPSSNGSRQHLLLQLSDHLGSASFVIDHGTGELVEHSTYQAYGGTDADYRPARWDSFREPYKFTGKEEDIEVGLQYFGDRYLSIGLGRWMSPDPVAIHALGSDPNPYAYVKGRPLVAVDPDGRELITLAAVLTAVAIGAAIGAGTAAAVYTATNYDNWKLEEFAVAAGVGAIAGGVSAGGGAWFGSLFASPLAGAVFGGAFGGATGAAAGYSAAFAGARILGRNGEFTGGGMWDAVWKGAVLGGLSGFATWGFQSLTTPRGQNGAAVKVRQNSFETPDEAHKWAASEFHDRVRNTGEEVGWYGYRNADGSTSIGTATAGNDTATNPLGHYDPKHDFTSFGHSHPNEQGYFPVNDRFSSEDLGYLRYRQSLETKGVDPGGSGAAQLGGQKKDVIQSYLATPRGALRAQTVGLNFRSDPSIREVGSYAVFRPTAIVAAVAGTTHTLWKSGSSVSSP